MTALSLILTGCGQPEEAKAEAEAGELRDPFASFSQESADYSNALSSLQGMLTTEKLNDQQERDLSKLISEMKESAALRARYENKK